MSPVYPNAGGTSTGQNGLTNASGTVSPVSCDPAAGEACSRRVWRTATVRRVFSPAGDESLASDRGRALRRSAKSSEAGIASALQNASIFSMCSKRELKLVARVAKTRNVPADVTLMVEGDPGDTMIVILSGKAEVRTGNRKIAELGAGDVVGELALLAKAPRNATVVTRSEAEIAVIGRRDLFRLIDDAPGFSRKLLEALAHRVRELDRRAFS